MVWSFRGKPTWLAKQLFLTTSGMAQKGESLRIKVSACLVSHVPICTGKIQVNYANVIPLLQLADKYNVRDLLKVNTSLSPVLWSQSWPAPDKINCVNTNLNNKYSLEKSSKIILLF